ncbi:ABC transporter ATP-binding protein [Microbacterium halotolerans]|uniref:ABC transporter ATP-binding protein n=1 Tax=Microbacterium halotolerans TaxID=246613 RepID=UPI000E6A9E4F|nr:ABC transporter ATP-binding protein [Microbacterium halotolerans]
MTLLTITDLSVDIAGRRVVDRVSFTVDRGERVGLIGESGSGKSLTCFAASGLLPERAVATGSVVVDGQEVLGSDEKRLASVRGSAIGMVFQEPQTALDPLMRVGRQMTSPLEARRRLGRRERERIAIELASEVGLPDPDETIRRYPHELSGGQRQRVVIAGALASRPSLLIADEPTTALDVTIQARILRLLEDRCRAYGAGLVLVTHDMAVAFQTCDRLLVMQGGRVVEHGTPMDLIERPMEAYTSALVEAAYETGWHPPAPAMQVAA